MYWIPFVTFNCFDFSNKSKILERRLRYLNDHFQYQLYDNVSRSTFAKHKVVFAFLLCANLQMWVLHGGRSDIDCLLLYPADAISIILFSLVGICKRMLMKIFEAKNMREFGMLYGLTVTHQFVFSLLKSEHSIKEKKE